MSPFSNAAAKREVSCVLLAAVSFVGWLAETICLGIEAVYLRPLYVFARANATLGSEVMKGRVNGWMDEKTLIEKGHRRLSSCRSQKPRN